MVIEARKIPMCARDVPTGEGAPGGVIDQERGKRVASAFTT